MNKFRKIIKKLEKYIKYKRQLNRKNYKISDDSKGIILISHDATQTGAPILLDHIAREMKRQNLTLFIISRKYGPWIVEFMKSGETKVIKKQIGFRKCLIKLRKLGFDKVICNTTVNGDLLPILKEYDFKVISLVHELPKIIHYFKIEDRAEKMAAMSDVAVFPSTYVYNKFQTIANVSVNYLIKPQGLYLTDTFDYNNEESKLYIQKEYFVPIRKKLILNVATGDKRKGYDLFLKVAYQLSKVEELMFVWVGDYDKKIYKSFLGDYNIKTLENLVQPGFINDPLKLSKFYQAADVFLLTSREDPFPSVVLQAFNAYTPVIAFENAGGFSDIVKNGETGYLVEYENLTALKEVILKILHSSDIIKMGENCKKKAEESRFDDYVKTLVDL